MIDISNGLCRVLGLLKFVKKPELTCVTNPYHDKYPPYY